MDDKKAPSANHPSPSRAWHALAVSEVLQELSTARSGLSSTDAARRFEQHGANRLREAPPPSSWRRLWAQFADVTVLALVAAAGVAVALGLGEDSSLPFLERFGDAIAITVIVALNATIGFVQERRAEAALSALRDLTSPVAVVLRSGVESTIPAREVVPGEVVLLDEGMRIPADVRLLEATRLRISEAALTGESAPVEKTAAATLDVKTALAERRNMAFMGTHVASGRGVGVVVGTGMQTELGQIAELLSEVTEPETPLQHDLQTFGTRLVIGCVVVGFIVFAVGLARGQANFGTLFMTAISLAVAAIPEGLPAVTTIVLALGMRSMARRSALVRRLSAVETLGAAELICTDKTGTLTENRMRIRKAATLSGEYKTSAETGRLMAASGELRSLDETPDLAALVSACRFAPAARLGRDENGEYVVVGDPTDGALLLLAAAHGRSEISETVLEEHPFDAEKKTAVVWINEGSSKVAYVHGAPEAILSQARGALGSDGTPQRDESFRPYFLELVESWAGEALRVLAVARQTGDELALLGIVGISDPPRAGVPLAVARARKAGVRTVMITGDHPRTASAIAREVGLDVRRVVAGDELEDIADAELEREVDGIDVVARATAAHKLMFVRALTAHGKVVAMTGDGVNDAPALRAATIGISMGRSGTDVAREASDIVLADDNYATIVGAIEEGRVIFSNIHRFIVFLLSINAGLVIAVFFAAIAGWPPLLNPTQILWINLVTNGLPALALGMEPVHLDHMSEPPRAPDAGLLSKRDVAWLVFYGAWMAAIGLGVFAWYASDEHRARTMAFIVLAIAPMFHALTCRSWSRSLFEMGPLTNRPLVGSFAVAVVLQGAAIYLPGLTGMFRTTPLPAADIVVAIGLSLTVFVVGELEKLIARLRSPEKHRTLSRPH